MSYKTKVIKDKPFNGKTVEQYWTELTAKHLVGKKIVKVEYFPKDNKIENGNTVFTSGKDGIFFPGIPIGNVVISGEEKQVLLLSDSHQLSFVNIVLTMLILLYYKQKKHVKIQ